MVNQKVVLLDGRGAGDDDLIPVLDTLMDELQSSGAKVQTFPLKDVKMGSCIGCFGCWLKTPGICVEPDAGRDIAQAVVQSDVTILLTPVTFGGYSSEIKKSQDRWIPLVLPVVNQRSVGSVSRCSCDLGRKRWNVRIATIPKLISMTARAKEASGSSVPNAVALLRKPSTRSTTVAELGQKRLRRCFNVTRRGAVYEGYQESVNVLMGQWLA